MRLERLAMAAAVVLTATPAEPAFAQNRIGQALEDALVDGVRDGIRGAQYGFEDRRRARVDIRRDAGDSCRHMREFGARARQDGRTDLNDYVAELELEANSLQGQIDRYTGVLPEREIAPIRDIRAIRGYLASQECTSFVPPSVAYGDQK